MSQRGRRTQEWDVRASTLARNTHNLIRSIVENLTVEPNPSKPFIALSVGEFLFTVIFFKVNFNEEYLKNQKFFAQIVFVKKMLIICD